jgi:MFS transporter, DHA2 family, multidrug resistance protein
MPLCKCNLDRVTDNVVRYPTETLRRFAVPSIRPSGADEAQQHAVVILGGQVRQQAFTLAYMDGFMVIAPWFVLE